MPPTIITAALLIIGDEILSGRTKDRNIGYIAEYMTNIGIDLREVRVVPDEEAGIVAALNALRHRYSYVFTTGGIGPTHDDITADCVAEAFGVKLIIHPEIAERIERRPAPPEIMATRMRMARVPEGATLIDNLTGGPQGFRIENVFVMAGIPAVMQAMLQGLAGKLEGGAIVRTRSVTAHVGESQIAPALRAIQERHPHIDLGSYPFFRADRYGTTLVMRGTDESRLEVMLAEVSAAIVAAGETPQDIQRS